MISTIRIFGGSTSDSVSQFPAKNNGPEFGRHPPLHCGNVRILKGIKQARRQAYIKPRKYKISEAVPRLSQPQNETLKASMRRRTAVGVNSLPRAVRKLLNGFGLTQETGSIVPSDASPSWVGMHSRVLW